MSSDSAADQEGRVLPYSNPTSVVITRDSEGSHAHVKVYSKDGRTVIREGKCERIDATPGQDLTGSSNGTLQYFQGSVLLDKVTGWALTTDATTHSASAKFFIDHSQVPAVNIKYINANWTGTQSFVAGGPLTLAEVSHSASNEE